MEMKALQLAGDTDIPLAVTDEPDYWWRGRLCLIYLVVLSFPPTTCSFSTGRLESRCLAGEARVSACIGSSSLLAHHHFIMHTYKSHAPISYAPIYMQQPCHSG